MPVRPQVPIPRGGCHRAAVASPAVGSRSAAASKGLGGGHRASRRRLWRVQRHSALHRNQQSELEVSGHRSSGTCGPSRHHGLTATGLVLQHERIRPLAVRTPHKRASPTFAGRGGWPEHWYRGLSGRAWPCSRIGTRLGRLSGAISEPGRISVLAGHACFLRTADDRS
jgi:hypothetical protein